MKMKKKGKVYPSPPPPLSSPSSSSSSSHHHFNEEESLSVLRLLPATILVLVTVLSAEDREVLAYLITRGISADSKKKKNKSSKIHKPPVFDCECFDCYTNYWLRWDSSPNRELIHEIIEAFENHHENSASHTNNNNNNKSKRGKKKEKPGRRFSDDKDTTKPVVEVEEITETPVPESHVSSLVNSPGRLEDEIVEEEEETSPVGFPTGHKGLARKVLPDVLGLFNSNFWRLWNPNA